MSWPSWASVSLTCPWPCARAVPGAVGLAAPWPLTVATGLAPGIAVETAWPRMICVTTCCPPWPGEKEVVYGTYRTLGVNPEGWTRLPPNTHSKTDPKLKINIYVCFYQVFVQAKDKNNVYLAALQGGFEWLSFPLPPFAESVFELLSFLAESDHWPEPKRIIKLNTCPQIYRELKTANSIYTLLYRTPAKGGERGGELERGGVPVAESLESWP